jgi:hypothetical protein
MGGVSLTTAFLTGVFETAAVAAESCSATLSVPSLFLSSRSKLLIVGVRNSSLLMVPSLSASKRSRKGLASGCLMVGSLAWASYSALLIEPLASVSNLAKVASR